ncbi:hypothetical protein C5S39_04345 [Candidatus Methanophagaceae archaeon]|nr:hypothetical protein C5S39_04345 [Methanophagales archaeon]
MTEEKCPSIEDLHDAKGVFLRDEPRDLFYRIATELIDLAIFGNSKTRLIEYLKAEKTIRHPCYYGSFSLRLVACSVLPSPLF